MNKRQLRKLAVQEPEEFRRYIRGARQREIVARALLLRRANWPTVSAQDLAALEEYVANRGWKSLYGHDRRMYYLLRAAADQWAKADRKPEKRDYRVQEAFSRGAQVREKLSEAEGGSLSLEAAAKEMRVSQREILRLYRARLLLGFEREQPGNLRCPSWQFKDHKLLPGLQKVLRELNKAKHLDDFGRMLFFLSSTSFLGQKRPLDCLRAGNVRQVLQAAQGFLCR